MPIAQSYNGHPSAGKYKDHLPKINCSDGKWNINLNLGSTTDEAVFQLTTFGRPNYLQRDVIVRFLEQTTFGPTTKLIDEMEENAATTGSLQTSFAHWIQTQQTEVSIGSNRALYRRHLNARFHVISPIGAVTKPCQAGTRYRRLAFSKKDINWYLDLALVFNIEIVLKVDGQVRTVVPTPLYYCFTTFSKAVEIDTGDWPDGVLSARICWIYHNEGRSGLTQYGAA